MAKEEGTGVLDGTETEWHADYGFTEDQLPTVKRYKSPQEFGQAFFEQRKKISQALVPPNADLKPDDYLKAVREARIKLGGMEAPDKYKVTIPDDVAPWLKANDPKYAKRLQEEAHKYGMTQLEVDELVDERMGKLREVLKTQADEAKKAEQEAKEQSVAKREALEKQFGKRTDEIVQKARLFARKRDEEGIFADDNLEAIKAGKLSDEVRADKGGLFEQSLDFTDPFTVRLYSWLYDKIEAESSGPAGRQTGPGAGVYGDRMEAAKKLYPNRRELWHELANGTAPLR